MNTIKGTAEVTFDVGGIMARIIGAEAAITRLILRLGENIDDYGLGISPIGVMASQDLKKALDKDIWDLARTETAQAGPRVAAEEAPESALANDVRELVTRVFAFAFVWSIGGRSGPCSQRR